MAAERTVSSREAAQALCEKWAENDDLILTTSEWVTLQQLIESALREAEMCGYNRRAKEEHDDAIGAAIEQSWQDRQGEDYGSY